MPAPTAPYDTLEQVVNAARMRLNDMIASVGGEVLTDTKPFTIVAINAAWRKFQEKLTSLGFLRFKNEVILFQGSLVPLSGPEATNNLDWTGFYQNGAISDPTVFLPQDFIAPIELRERNQSDNGAGQFYAMDFMPSGLPLVPKTAWNKYWTWRGESIWLTGSQESMDLWIRYWSYAPDFVASGSTPPLVVFASQPVPIMRALDPFSLYLAAEIAAPRGDLTAQTLITAADAAATILVGRENPSVLPPAQPAPPQAGA